MKLSRAILLLGAVGCGQSSVNALSNDGGLDGIPNLGVDAAGIGSAQCSNGRDDDGDGLPDYLDPECVGPLDDDESSFATGIPGDNIDPCRQDCFFDGNSGMGDDRCLWQLRCDPANTNAACPYDPAYAAQHETECSISNSQSQDCVNRCRPLVPNGCDCFGCCEIPGQASPIRIGPGCTAADFGDPAKCPRCTIVTQCSNPCEHCELCVGKPELPADCRADGGTSYPKCDNGYTPCGPGTPTPADGCPENYGCITGCCTPLIVVP